ncbi:hypothetical protein F8M41_004025 [Gigaspora margarita]|uniref:Uncharacterized protein n=1 Tax=Gigaspora margarita TaxID=4874 RepID=A0A8H3XAC7_GIGMA|nr:hypothetical protein F8M41_004025 [Gigaspora margarita]
MWFVPHLCRIISHDQLAITLFFAHIFLSMKNESNKKTTTKTNDTITNDNNTTKTKNTTTNDNNTTTSTTNDNNPSENYYVPQTPPNPRPSQRTSNSNRQRRSRRNRYGHVRALN